jgi:hypothetical protein
VSGRENFIEFFRRECFRIYKVVQIWPGLILCKQVTICPGHIWTTLYINSLVYTSESWLKKSNGFIKFTGRKQCAREKNVLDTFYTTHYIHMSQIQTHCCPSNSNKGKSHWITNCVWDLLVIVTKRVSDEYCNRCVLYRTFANFLHDAKCKKAHCDSTDSLNLTELNISPNKKL